MCNYYETEIALLKMLNKLHLEHRLLSQLREPELHIE